MRFLVLVLALLIVGSPVARAEGSAPVHTGQNLPGLGASALYMAGDGFADEIRAYRTSGDYLKDQQRIARKATEHLDRFLAECRTDRECRPAIVFDIDDTLLSWYGVYARNGFAPSTSVWDSTEERCVTPVIPPVKRLYDRAKSLGVTPILITGRSEQARAVTEACLAKRGITDYGQLILRSPAEEAMTAAAYKLQEREALAAAGWDLSLSIGDQFSDSAGTVPTGRFVLPNPMYFIP